MADDLDRPVYLVVGAGPGMGLWCASRFAAHGWQTVLVDHESGAVEAVAGQLAEMHPDAPRALTSVADAGDPNALRACLEGLALSRVDVAHFNVSTWVPGALNSDLAEVSAGLDTGAVSALAMVQAVQPQMSAAGQGAVIFTGSGAADQPSAASFGLGMQKAALRNLAIGLQPVLAPDGIRILHFTIYGVLAPDSPFSPPVISERIAELVLDASGTGLLPLAATPQWDPVVPYRG